jgi:transcriptional regulator GlxA family with amidase domain
MRCSLDILMKRSAMLKVPNEETSECFFQESPPLVPEMDSGVRVNLRLIAGNQPNGTNAVGLVRGGLPPRALRRVREHIDANIKQRISVKALAKLANLSVWYFVRAFKQSVGVTPHNYLIRRRVERTSELLSGTELSLSEIALAAGFADQSHCARRFRQHVGMSPREYRWLMS